jgi:outer membrane protein TolC
LNIRQVQGLAASALLLASTISTQAWAQTTAPAAPQQTAQSTVGPKGAKNSAGMDTGDFPAVPQPVLTKPFDMRSTAYDYTHPKSHFPNPFAPYTALNVPPPEFNNTTALDQLVRDGKIYLSLSDAIKLALANNYDIAIQRYNLDIADTDILRAKAGSTLRGVSAGVVQGTLGGATATQLSGGGPGGTSVAAGGSASGASGLVLSTNGGGPLPEYRDPVLTGQLQLQRESSASTSALSPPSNTNTDFYNFGYSQGFSPGASLNVTFDNQRQTTNNPFASFSPALTSSFQATLTQHLLQGRGFFINNRFIVQAKRDRQITDSAFRQQVLSTVNQVENIYWGLVSAYEDVQAKERALDQSRRLAADNRKQLQIGTLAPLDVTNADSSVATDEQSLVNSQTTLEYQQLVMKQAIARNLDDPIIASATVVPTDRVSLDKMEAESAPVETLVQEAYVNRPEVEQAKLNLQNAALTVKAIKNELLPQVDLYGFYGAAAAGGSQSPECETFSSTGAIIPCPPGTVPTINYTNVFQNLFNSSNPDKGAGINVNITLRNRVAQADQARSQLEYRQAQMKLAQLYVQIRIQVINAQFALTQDRAAVQAASAARDYQNQSLDAENKKYKLGASTTQLVLQQKRNVATAEANYITAITTYARDRASLDQILADTLQRYGIDIADTARGTVNQAPVVPGLVPATDTTPAQPQPQSQTQPQAPGL